MNSTLSTNSESWIVQAWPGGAETGDSATDRGAAGESGLLPAEFIIRTLAGFHACANSADASRLVANRLQQFLGCRQVAVGLCRGPGRRCSIQGLSGVVRFDSHSGFVRAVQDALEETLVRGKATTWPSQEASEGHGSLAHERLVSMLGADCVLSVPLQQEDGQIVGVVLLIDEPAGSVLEMLSRYGSALATGLAFMERNQRGYLARQLHRAWSACFTWRGRAACLAAAAAFLALAIPWPYRVHCDCQIQPVTRRFIAAPYDGTLDKTLVSPGDVVHKGDILARMDQREIQWELAGLEADLAHAEKERDAAMAAHHISRAQLAELELERLKLQKQLLEHRAQNLEIKSPISGIVVVGDLEKAEGAPLVIGQTLFEVAPLDQMVVEVNVPEEEVSFVKPGASVSVLLDAYSDETLVEGVLEQLHPQAELREHKSVFIAEFSVDNRNGRLRPGMNGEAKVESGRRWLGWILFHRPWARVRRALAW